MMDTLSAPTTAAQASAFMAQNGIFNDKPTGMQLPEMANNNNGPQVPGVGSASTAMGGNNFHIKQDPALMDKGITVPSNGNLINNNQVETKANLQEQEDSSAGILPTVQNIVATVNLGCRLDLKTIALHARNAEYNPKRFAAVVMRIREPKTTALIFASGKMVVTGAKSEDDSKLASRKYARIIQKLGFNAKFTDFKIQNIVASCDVKFPIRLEGLAFSHGTFSSYEPELFPGLIYRMVKPKIVLLIFVSGKIVLTGAKHREEIYAAFKSIYPVLNEFRKA